MQESHEQVDCLGDAFGVDRDDTVEDLLGSLVVPFEELLASFPIRQIVLVCDLNKVSVGDCKVHEEPIRPKVQGLVDLNEILLLAGGGQVIVLHSGTIPLVELCSVKLAVGDGERLGLNFRLCPRVFVIWVVVFSVSTAILLGGVDHEVRFVIGLLTTPVKPHNHIRGEEARADFLRQPPEVHLAGPLLQGLGGVEIDEEHSVSDPDDILRL